MNRALVDPGLAERQRFMRMGNTDKLGVAIRHAALRLPAQARDHAMALVDPGNLAIMAGALAIWVGAQATPVGWVVNIAMMGVGVAAVGAQAVDVAREIRDFALGVLSADNTADLRAAGDHLAKAVAMVGVDLVVALLLKKAIVKVREPKMPKPEGGESKLLFGKYDPRTAQRSLPPEKPSASPGPIKTPNKSQANGPSSQASIRARVKANIAESAAARNASKFEQLSRYETAYKYYADAGYSADRISGHLAGIDFTKPVALTELTPGSTYLQYPLNGKMGNYFTTVGTPAEMIGINPAGRVPTLFTPTKPVKALQSTAADVLDTWTVPSQPYMSKGGGVQFFVPNKDAFVQVPTL